MQEISRGLFDHAIFLFLGKKHEIEFKQLKSRTSCAILSLFWPHVSLFFFFFFSIFSLRVSHPSRIYRFESHAISLPISTWERKWEKKIYIICAYREKLYFFFYLNIPVMYCNVMYCWIVMAAYNYIIINMTKVIFWMTYIIFHKNLDLMGCFVNSTFTIYK